LNIDGKAADKKLYFYRLGFSRYLTDDQLKELVTHFLIAQMP